MSQDYSWEKDLSISDLCYLVDVRVNIKKDMTLDEALAIIVPEEKRDAVRAEYESWYDDMGDDDK